MCKVTQQHLEVRPALETQVLVCSPGSFPGKLCDDQLALRAGEGPMADVIDDSVLCPLWGLLVENTEVAAGPLGLRWATDTLGLCPPGQGLKVAMEISSPQPLQARHPSAGCLRRRGKTDTAQLPQRKPRSFRKADAATICIVDKVSQMTFTWPSGLGTGRDTCGRGWLSPLGSDEECGTNELGVLHCSPSQKNFFSNFFFFF